MHSLCREMTSLVLFIIHSKSIIFRSKLVTFPSRRPAREDFIVRALGVLGVYGTEPASPNLLIVWENSIHAFNHHSKLFMHSLYLYYDVYADILNNRLFIIHLLYIFTIYTQLNENPQTNILTFLLVLFSYHHPLNILPGSHHVCLDIEPMAIASNLSLSYSGHQSQSAK
ncbi:hypothetical protein BDV24DRAFT_49574 [Aspergillus arachidicola]|uniref:Uncharacterized protein n=1 Tax=Aspergillus arachidicola TaxID=656916 RepID=A0A5N6YB08_9EURO|nr:hypothetical protein BDV24DRAFT_49574 [Aspergillus arachidicola]